MTNKEREIIRNLNHPLYTVEFLEEWINRKDNVLTNTPAALQAAKACGFYEAVKRMAMPSDYLVYETGYDNGYQRGYSNGYEDGIRQPI